MATLKKKNIMLGHKVSNSNIKTKRKFQTNNFRINLKSIKLGQFFKLKISAKTLRTIDFMGGLDEFILKIKKKELSNGALKIRKKLQKDKSC